MFKDLSLVQKGMVLVYEKGYKLPWLEKYVQQLHKFKKRADVQTEYQKRQEDAIGDFEARRKYWIDRLTKEQA